LSLECKITNTSDVKAAKSYFEHLGNESQGQACQLLQKHREIRLLQPGPVFASLRCDPEKQAVLNNTI